MSERNARDSNALRLEIVYNRWMAVSGLEIIRGG